MVIGYSESMLYPQKSNVSYASNPSRLRFQGTWVEIRNTRLPASGSTYLFEQLQANGSLGKQGITYAVDVDGDRLMIYDSNRRQKDSIEKLLKGRGLFSFFRYTKKTVEPTHNISLQEPIRAYEILQAAIADRSNIDLEKVLEALTILQRTPHFQVLGLNLDSEDGKISGENVLAWLQGADAEQRLRQLRSRWN